MEQTKALVALEPFLALTKSASSPRAAVDLITRATSAPNTYIFTPLLASPQISALQTDAEHCGHYTLLQIFSYGTYTTYRSTPSLPALSTGQLLKLRQLSLLSLAKNPQNLKYDTLMRVLELSTARELEDLVISAIYAGLLSATLNPQQKLVCISSVSPLRDVLPSSIAEMLGTLKEWESRCMSTLQDLEAQIAKITQDSRQRHLEEREWAKTMEKMIDEVAPTGGAGHDGNAGRNPRKAENKRSLGRGTMPGAFGPGDGGGREMDVDEDLHEEEGRVNAKMLKKGVMHH